MIRWYSYVFFLSATSFCYSQIRETEYECGAHGRFEYCIDGIPGCVIGCHCHPGYYFDTDTKICEPNIKLTQNFRRQQYDYPEPTRAYPPPLLPEVNRRVYHEPATTVRSAVDEKLDIITKDADDLGDWLYNQFFKTIENQVINETKNDAVLTRRSGSRVDASQEKQKKPSRRSHKYWKGRRKRKKKKKGIKSKLLRITKDDSLFDSQSDSDSDSDSETSSDTSESDSSESKEKSHIKGHGHKKLIVFSKVPKPPLPSFIFLPNMETPFFPPIGLPPPAIPMPMYPMVPVPPVMGPPPLFPFPGEHSHEGEKESTTATTTSASSSTTATTLAATEGHTTTAAPAADDAATEDVAKDINSQPDEDKSPSETKEGPESKEEETSTPHQEPSALRSRIRGRGKPRNKMVQKLRNKLMRKQLQNHIPNTFQLQQPPSLESHIKPNHNCVTNNDNPHKVHMGIPNFNIRDQIPDFQDVDFKYLSQLIHRADLNNTNHDQFGHRERMKDMFGHNKHRPQPLPLPSRRVYGDINTPDIRQVLNDLSNQPAPDTPYLSAYNVPNALIQTPQNVGLFANPYRNKIEDTNDTYYANLGRQIASMIRNIEGDKDVDIDISKGSPIPKNSGFNGFNYGSRSYWERSVRSPYKYLKSQRNTFKKDSLFPYYDDNSLAKILGKDDNLYSLENKVVVAASTAPTLNLHELENIISKMEKVKSSLIRKTAEKRTESSKTSFNVNLLPGNDRKLYADRIVNKQLSHNIPTQTKHSPFNSNDDLRKQLQEATLLLEPKVSFVNYRNLLTDVNETEKLNKTTTENSIPSPVSTRMPNVFIPQRYHNIERNNLYYENNMLPSSTVQPPQRHLSDVHLPYELHTTTGTRYVALSPMVFNQKSFNYYPDNNNQYVYKKALVPVRYSSLSSRRLFGRMRPPSNSHHKVHHFNYFNDLF